MAASPLGRWLEQNALGAAAALYALPVCIVWVTADGQVALATAKCQEWLGEDVSRALQRCAAAEENQGQCLCGSAKTATPEEPHMAVLFFPDDRGGGRWMGHVCAPVEATKGRVGVFVPVEMVKLLDDVASMWKVRQWHFDQVLEAFYATHSLEEAAQIASDGLLDIMGADEVLWAFFPPDAHSPPLVAASRALLPRCRRQIEAVALALARDGLAEPLWVSDVQSERQALPPVVRPWLAERQIGAVAMLPVVDDEVLLGVGMVCYRHAHRFRAQERRWALLLRDALATRAQRLWKRAALEKSRQQWLALAEGVLVGICVISRGRFVYVNPAVERLTGWSEAELLRKPYWFVIAPQERRRVRRWAAAQWRGTKGAPSQIEVRLRRKDGSLRWALLDAVRMVWQDDEVMLGSAMDIEQQKRTEEALRASEARFRGLAESAAVGVFVIQNERFVFVNRMLADLCGRAVSDFAQLPVAEVLHPEERQRVLQRGQARLRGEDVPTQYETRVLKPDGEVRWVLLGVGLTEWRGALAIVGTVTDLTERKYYQRLLEEEIRLVHAIRRRAVQEQGVAAAGDEMVAAVMRLLPQAKRVALFAATEEGCCVVAQQGWKALHGVCLDNCQTAAGAVGQQGVLRSGSALAALLPEVPPEAWASENHVLVSALQWEGRLLGLLAVALGAETRPAAEVRERHLGEHFLAMQALLLRDALLWETLQRRLAWLQALDGLAQSLGGILEERQGLAVLLQHLQGQFHADGVSAWLWDDLEEHLVLQHAQGFVAPLLQPLSPLGAKGSLASEVAVREQLVVRNLEAATVPEAMRPWVAHAGVQGYIGVPLMTREGVRGVVELFFRRPLSALEPGAREFLEAAGRYGAFALENARLVRRLQASAQALQEAYESTLEGWARALELRDDETEGHTRRVVDLTLRLARRLGASEEGLANIRRGALLHDIGKIAIPDHILRKPGPLSPEEWEIMRQHPLLAYEMLRNIAHLRPALSIPLSHHERWDGSGYPQGLRGEEIPWPARVFAVVDVYDALTSDRPYRRAWPREKALAYLKENSGKLFDPQVVAAFLEMLAEEQAVPDVDVGEGGALEQPG